MLTTSLTPEAFKAGLGISLIIVIVCQVVRLILFILRRNGGGKSGIYFH